MAKDIKKRILIVEDAEDIARGYQTILEREGKGKYDVTVCLTGEEVQRLIDEKQKFDIVVMDIMMPAENLKKHTLEDCHSTGLRLVKQMVKKHICRRFYVITVRPDLKHNLEKICNKAAHLEYEDKLDHEPEKFCPKVEMLLAKQMKSLR